MLNKIIASAALLASATLVEAVGKATVVNACSDPATLSNVPASGGGQNQIGPQTLQPGGSYSQTYTQLSNGQGWSLKLYKGSDMNNLVQFEYTYPGDGVIWYDLSAVNGDPWNGDWSIGATGGCDPKQTAYRYPTDDTYGMQSSCPDSDSVTVTLCGNSGGGSGGSSPPAYSSPQPAQPAPAPTSNASPAAPAPAAPTSYASPAAPSPAAPSPAAPAPAPAGSNAAPQAQPPAAPYVSQAQPQDNGPVYSPSAAADKLQGLQATTFATKVANAAETVTNMHTHVVTQYVTVSPVPAAPAVRRHEHLHRHAHHHERI